jgi:hypothetical protein
VTFLSTDPKVAMADAEQMLNVQIFQATGHVFATLGTLEMDGIAMVWVLVSFEVTQVYTLQATGRPPTVFGTSANTPTDVHTECPSDVNLSTPIYVAGTSFRTSKQDVAWMFHGRR